MWNNQAVIRKLCCVSIALAISCAVYWLIWYILHASHFAEILWPVYLLGLKGTFHQIAAAGNNPILFVLGLFALLAYLLIPIIGIIMISEVPKLAYAIAANLIQRTPSSGHHGGTPKTGGF